MSFRIDTVAGRSKLKPKKGNEPYWHRLASGHFVGYRPSTTRTGGTWLARIWISATGKKPSVALSGIDTYPAHEHFTRAVERANAWFETFASGFVPSSNTVGDACKEYVKHTRVEKGEKAANDAEGRFKRWLYDTPLAATELSRLRTEDIQALRNRLATVTTRKKKDTESKAPAKSTVNREMTPLRAALNLAHEKGHTNSDLAWRKSLKPIKGASNRRELYLNREQRASLLSHADPDFVPFLKCLASLPLRPGALAALSVGSFDIKLNTISIRADKGHEVRYIELPNALAGYLASQIDSRDPTEPLLPQPNGAPWNKDTWNPAIKQAAKAASLPPSSTAYTLRHSVITDLIVGGLDLLTVARISGTSITMIEKHYGHFRRDAAKEALGSIAL